MVEEGWLKLFTTWSRACDSPYRQRSHARQSKHAFHSCILKKKVWKNNKWLNDEEVFYVGQREDIGRVRKNELKNK